MIGSRNQGNTARMLAWLCRHCRSQGNRMSAVEAAMAAAKGGENSAAVPTLKARNISRRDWSREVVSPVLGQPVTLRYAGASQGR